MDNRLSGELLNEEPLHKYTTWRVGGIAKTMYKPKNIQDLAVYLQMLPATEPLLWLGLGSNSLIKDDGFAGTVILTQGCLSNIDLLSPVAIRVEAGVSCAKMARFCAKNHLAGAEFWAGIPGTMGGALRMNAGCYNGETWNFVTEVEIMNRAGNIIKKTKSDFDIAYRHVEGLQEDEWFVAATFNFQKGNKDVSLTAIKELLARRSATQPTNQYNCGSVFRNPPNNYAAKLIEECKLKGYKIGGAQVSEKHANFIINFAGEVYEKTSVNLIQEVHIIGD
jgi:UDP-N-acetylmuramate dehydrogenase